MGDQTEKKFSWVLKKFSSLQDDKCYSRPFPFAGCNWRLLAYPKGDKNNGYLSVYLEPADPAALPPGWRSKVKLSLTLVNKGWGKSNLVLGGTCCFDTKRKSWGAGEFVPLSKIHAKGEGFLVNNKLIILAHLHLLPIVQNELLKVTEIKGNQAFDASVTKSHGESSCQVVQKTENAAKENLDDEVDDDESEEGSDDDDDDSSEEGSDDDEESEEGSDDNETEVSNGDNDDEPKEDVDDDEDSSFVLIGGARDVSSPDQVKSLEGASQTVENDGKGSNNIASVTETSNKETQPEKETMNVHGFEVFTYQVERVSHIFERHPDIASGFHAKNQNIRRAYMNELLSLIEMLCQSPEKLSESDLSNAEDTLTDLIDIGFKLDWLKTKVNEVSEKKMMEQGSGDRLQTMEEQLQKLKQMFLDLETQMQKEKAEALAARVPLSFNDVVC